MGMIGNILAKKLEHERREDSYAANASANTSSSALQEKQRQDFEDEVSVLKSVEEEKRDRRARKTMMKYLYSLSLQKDKLKSKIHYRGIESNVCTKINLSVSTFSFLNYV